MLLPFTVSDFLTFFSSLGLFFDLEEETDTGVFLLDLVSFLTGFDFSPLFFEELFSLVTCFSSSSSSSFSSLSLSFFDFSSWSTLSTFFSSSSLDSSSSLSETSSSSSSSSLSSSSCFFEARLRFSPDFF